MVRFISASKSDVGLKRANNEDAFFDCPQSGLFAVSDGMGGAAAGEVASRMFIDTVVELFGAKPNRTAKYPYDLVQEVFKVSNERIIGFASKNSECSGMGCTADLIAFCGEQFVIGHVGDSRIYLYRNTDLLQLTKDHTLVQQQIDKGFITTAEAKLHSRRNVLLSALGIDFTLSFDIMRGKSYDNDIFLLCSDGLTSMLEDEALKSVLASRKTLAEKVENLIGLANAAGGKDNITVLVFQVVIT